jgi:cytochrome b561
VSYEEKGKWVYLLSSLGAYVGYVTVVLNRADGRPLTEVAYIAPLLWSIGISIGVSIVARILFEIVRPSESYKVDVRDKDIERRGQYVAGFVIMIAMILPLGLAMAEADHFWIANAIYAAFVLSSVVGESVKLIAYRRGM